MVPLSFWAVFLFILGCCIGSFLNVVVWRLPRQQSVSKPRHSYCPHCNKTIAWYDNIPILSWIVLRARCRQCGGPISVRYPLVELGTGLLFIGLLLGIYAGPGALRPDIGPWPDNWPGYAAAVILMSALLAGSLIDLEHFIIPLEVVWAGGIPAIVLATLFPGHLGMGSPGFTGLPGPGLPGFTQRLGVPMLHAAEWLPIGSPSTTAWAIGGAFGLLISIGLLWAGVLPLSFPQAEGDPENESKPRPAPAGKGKNRKKSKSGRVRDERRQEPGPGQGPGTGPGTGPGPGTARLTVGVTVGARREVLKEVLFLLPVVVGGLIWWRLTNDEGPFNEMWLQWCQWPHLTGLGGSLFGVLIGGATVWFVRIVGTLIAGREAMGLGDVHVLAAAGAVIGWGGSVLAFFIAPFFALAIALVQYFRHGRRELPFGPYLSLGVLTVLMFYDRLAEWLGPSLDVIFNSGGAGY